MPPEILYGLLAFLAAIVIGLIGVIWHMHSGAQSDIFNILKDMRELIAKLEASLRGDLTELDRRVTRLEEWRKGRE
jgi:hypothetical protein